ncbi:sodium channel protein Nach-like [Choristoneura fumiferana]|uniref:sodium channel protein Nach-like n=1 Tax=Choristoneura fumiferana TaxID=7141 RepID=UPI003D1547B8
MDILKKHYYTMDTIMEEVVQKCENLLLYCTFNRKVKNCVHIFNLIKTVEGHCCTFNYAALNDVAENPLLPHDETLEYYDDEETDDEVLGPIIATSESGRTSGLTVVFNVEPEDYPSWSTVANYGATILISDPNDFPETSVKDKYVTTGTSVDIKVEPKVYQSESDLRHVVPSRRACWFHDEVTLEHTDRYSYETCITECTMNNFIQFCGCTPYKYPRDGSRRFCELADLPCMHNLTVYGKGVPCDPPCYVECRDKGYSIAENTVPFLADDFPANVTSGRPLNSIASIKVYFRKSTCNCYKLTLLMDVNYFIATYGGVLSLSFGASLLTIVELLYLFISYLVQRFSKYFDCYQ